MGDVERNIVRSYWDTPATDATNLPSTEPLIPAIDPARLASRKSASPDLAEAVKSTATAASLTAALPIAIAAGVIMKAASFIGHFSDLVDNYRKSNKPYNGGPKETPEEVTEAIDHVRDLEDFSATLTEKSQAKEDEEDSSLIDEKLQELVPTDHYTESPTQTALTIEEGKVIEAFLNPTDTSPPPSVGIPEGEAPDVRTIKDRLDDIITRSPEIKGIYERALSLPTTKDHNDCKELLMKMGVPVLEAIAPYEAEGLAASMAKAGLVDYVGTEDSDVLAYEVSLTHDIGVMLILHIRDHC